MEPCRDPPILYILILPAPLIGQRAYNVSRKFLSIRAFETFYESSVPTQDTLHKYSFVWK